MKKKFIYFYNELIQLIRVLERKKMEQLIFLIVFKVLL